MLLASLIFVELVETYTLYGERPRAIFNSQGTGVVAQSCAATCQITREGGAIIDICMVFGSIALVSLHARGSSL